MPSVRSQSCEIYYETRGEGPAVVFAHGMGGNRMSWWQQVPYFERQGYRVITFDHRGFGRSACAAAEFHPARFPADLCAILDREQIGRAALVCQSMGGWTGLPMAVQTAERVGALALCGTPGGLATEKVAEARSRLASTLADQGVRGNAALAPDYPEREPAMALLYDQINSLNPGLDLEALATFADPAAQVLPEALAGYSVPTLVLSGDRDQLFPPDVLHDVAARIPGAELVSFPGIGHSTYFEDAGRFNEVVGVFLEKHRPGFA
jgi:pimeloyl-ACP methyl ester carboxylesterase